jgi:O-antigen/teichoic acid export membrane protein
MALVLLTAGLLGGLTEAHEYGKKDLLNYTTVSGFKWSFTWTLYLSVAFLAIAETFIIGASGPLWIRAAQLLPLFLIQRMIGPPSWMSDQAFPAANKPIYASVSWIIEQGLRAILMLIFLITFRVMEAVLWAYIISLIVKDIFVIITLRIKVNKWDWNVWPTYIAPILSAGLIFLLFKVFELFLVDGLGLGQGLISAMLLLILVLFVGEFFHSFFYGIFGGYDDNTLEELHRSANMVTGVGFFARFYYRCAAIGCKISPLHNKFPITVYEAAKLEADELTSIKRKLVE